MRFKNYSVNLSHLIENVSRELCIQVNQHQDAFVLHDLKNVLDGVYLARWWARRLADQRALDGGVWLEQLLGQLTTPVVQHYDANITVLRTSLDGWDTHRKTSI